MVETDIVIGGLARLGAVDEAVVDEKFVVGVGAVGGQNFFIRF